MIEVVWEFRVKPQLVGDFETDYSSLGPWATLFRNSPAYRGTRLLRDQEDPLRFLTIDTWDHLDAYENFRLQHAEEYRELDGRFERLTEAERRIGIFEVL